MVKDILNFSNYSVIKRIGTGTRSAIYLAKDEIDNTQIALKRVVYERPEDSRVFEQMENEYKTARQIDHPYIRKCYKLKKIRKLLKTNEVLLSMEMFEGQTLEESSSLSLVDILLIFRMVATGLNAMHHRGFVHCDIKPNNILINPTGAIKIIDLGQSCRSGAVKPRIQGTPDYIAPEQVRREPITQKTDVFNLGATMYWAITGKNVPTLIAKKTKSLGLVNSSEDCPSPHQLKKQIPIGVSKLVMDCVKDRPENRPDGMNVISSRLDLLIHSILGDKLNTRKNGAGNN